MYWTLWSSWPVNLQNPNLVRNVLSRFFGRRNICGKLLKRRVCGLHCYLQYHCWIGADRVWHILNNLMANRNTPQRGFAQATGTSNVPSPHLSSLPPNCFRRLDFWIQGVEVLTNSTSCISTTCRHPLARPPISGRWQPILVCHMVFEPPSWKQFPLYVCHISHSAVLDVFSTKTHYSCSSLTGTPQWLSPARFDMMQCH